MIWALKHWRLVGVAALAVAVVVLAFLLAAQVKAARGADQKREAAELRLAGEVVAREATERELRKLVAKDADLERQVRELEARSPGVVVRTVERVVTVEVPAVGVPLPPGPPCLLPEGGRGVVRCTVVQLQTGLGNVVVRGRAEAVRTHPLPETVILSGPFDSKVSVVDAVPPVLVKLRDPLWELEVGAEWQVLSLNGGASARLQRDPSLYRAALARRVLPWVYVGAVVSTPDGRAWQASLGASGRFGWGR